MGKRTEVIRHQTAVRRFRRANLMIAAASLIGAVMLELMRRWPVELLQTTGVALLLMTAIVCVVLAITAGMKPEPEESQALYRTDAFD